MAGNTDASFRDQERCRTSYLTDQLWKCLAVRALDCPFAINFGDEYFCLHQDSEKFEKLPSGVKRSP